MVEKHMYPNNKLKNFKNNFLSMEKSKTKRPKFKTAWNDKKAIETMNFNKSVKFDLIPEKLENKSISGKEHKEIYNFHRSEKVQQDPERHKLSDK